MNKDKIIEIIKIINMNLENKLDLQKTDDILNINLQDRGMDSIIFIRVIVSIEEKLKIEIPEFYLLLTEMNTVNKIINVIENI